MRMFSYPSIRAGFEPFWFGSIPSLIWAILTYEYTGMIVIHLILHALDYSVNQQQFYLFEYKPLYKMQVLNPHSIYTHDKSQYCLPTEKSGVVSSLIVESGVCCSSPGDMYIIHDLI